MIQTVLSPNQKKFIVFFVSNPYLKKTFYLAGGTCLSEFYLRHQYSEDLDFFSEKEINITSITSLLKQSKRSWVIKKLIFKLLLIGISIN